MRHSVYREETRTGQALCRFHRTPTIPTAHPARSRAGTSSEHMPDSSSHSSLTTSGLRCLPFPQASPALPGTVRPGSMRSDPRPGQSYMCSWPVCFNFCRVHGPLSGAKRTLPQSLIYTQQRRAGQKARRADPESQWIPSTGKNAFALREHKPFTMMADPCRGVLCRIPSAFLFSGGPYP